MQNSNVYTFVLETTACHFSPLIKHLQRYLQVFICQTDAVLDVLSLFFSPHVHCSLFLTRKTAQAKDKFAVSEFREVRSEL